MLYPRKMILRFAQDDSALLKNRLVYYEHFTDIRIAIAREREIKGWKRFKKLKLIRSQNPEWKDLSLEWSDPND